MIQYEEPSRVKLSADEEKASLAQFVRVLQAFLLLYLALHNLVIPVILNAYKGHALLSDVHFWFLTQVLIAWSIRYSPKHADGLIAAVAVGSILRLVTETLYLAGYGLTWGLFSIWLSELSSFVLYFFYFTHLGHRPRWEWRWMFLPLLVPLFTHFEVRGELFKKPVDFVRERQIDESWLQKGCEGSLIEWSVNKQVARNGSIQKCGFTHQVVDLSVPIENLSKDTVQFRVARLRLFDQVLKADFVRLVILKPKEKIVLEGSENEVFLLSSIQQKWLGLQLKVGSNAFTAFPHGTYQIDPYKLEYRP